MKVEDLLKASATGMPLVKVSPPVRGATSDVGQVVLIKQNRKWKGCAVEFPGLLGDTWFSDDPAGTDKRSRYMHQLTLIAKHEIEA